MNWINFSILILSAGMVINAWMIVRQARIIVKISRMHMEDMKLVHQLFDNHLKTHESIGEHQGKLLTLLKTLNEPEKE